MRVLLVISAFLLTSCMPLKAINEDQYTNFEYDKFYIPYSEMEKGNTEAPTLCKVDSSCASASVSIILNNKFGVKLSEVEVWSGLFQKGVSDVIKGRNGFSLLDIKQYLESEGYQADGFSLTKNDFIAMFEKLDNDDQFPVVIPVSYIDVKRYVVLVGGDTTYAYIYDPAFGRYKIKHHDFFNIIDTKVILVISEK